MDATQSGMGDVPTNDEANAFRADVTNDSKPLQADPAVGADNKAQGSMYMYPRRGWSTVMWLNVIGGLILLAVGLYLALTQFSGADKNVGLGIAGLVCIAIAAWSFWSAYRQRPVNL